MKPDSFLKTAAWVFAGALAVYIFAYAAIEHQRTRQGPWEITFTNDSAGAAALLINQPRLALTNVLIAFPGNFPPVSARLPSNLVLTQPVPTPFDVPFGRCIFLDLTSQPGTIVLEMFGHEIQLLPRVLTIDQAEQPWKSGQRTDLASRP